jgi:lipopolysaccharide transport system ATP-binding protein
VYAPTQGQVFRQGSVSSLIDLSLGINPESSGRENIYLRGALLGMNRKEIDSQLESIIEFSELGEFIDLPLRIYSSGMSLRLAFSISTRNCSEVLLMDEWLSIGDENFRRKADERLEEIIKTTKILVIASHSRELIMKNCNRVLWLEHGTLRMDGKPDEVCDAYFG